MRTDLAICREMKGWTLDYVRSLDVDDYDEAVAWLQDQAARARGDDASIDMDALMRARFGTTEDPDGG